VYHLDGHSNPPRWLGIAQRGTLGSEVSVRKPKAKTILKAALSVLLGALLLEGVLQLFPGRLFQRDPAWKGDAFLGIPLCHPDIATDFPEAQKPTDVYRIVVLGDSHMCSVDRASSFPEVLESLLDTDELGGRRVEVYNAGALGHSHYQYYLTLTERLALYQPDLVIVAPYIGNDFLDLYRIDDRPRLAFENGEFIHKPPEFAKYWDPAGGTILDSSRVLFIVRACLGKTLGYLWNRTHVLFAVGKRASHDNLAAARFVSTMIRGSFVNDEIFRQDMNQIVFLRTFPEGRADIDRVNRRVTDLMKAFADSKGIKLLYVPIPTKLQVEPDSDPEVLKETLEICGLDRSVIKDEDELCDSLVALLAEHGIESLRVDQALREAARAGAMYDVTYHLNQRAHAIVAQAIHNRVKEIVNPSR